jgi:hypothetical protein
VKGFPHCDYDADIKTDAKEISFENVDWISIVYDSSEWRLPLNISSEDSYSKTAKKIQG